jgi:hypothetical protein
MAKKIDPQAKAKRQKVIAAVLGAVLLAVLAFQGPRTLKMLHQSSASASPAATTPAATGATEATGAVSGSTSGSGSTGDGLTDPGVLPAPQSGQLLAFSRFRSKDPFTQQINIACASDSGSSGGCGSGTATTQPSGSGTATKPSAPKQSAPTATGGTTAVKATTAEISVNGTTESVTVGAKFPASNPTFVLVSLAKSSAKIGIAGGSLEGSKQTVTLKKGVALTLMNTADGTRYVLRLVSIG